MPALIAASTPVAPTRDTMLDALRKCVRLLSLRSQAGKARDEVGDGYRCHPGGQRRGPASTGPSVDKSQGSGVRSAHPFVSRT